MEGLRKLREGPFDLILLHAILVVIVHELRNPAGVLKNYLQLMRAGYVDDDEWDEYLEKLDLRGGSLKVSPKSLRNLNCTQENCTLLTIFQKRGIIEWLRVGVLEAWVFRQRGKAPPFVHQLGRLVVS